MTNAIMWELKPIPPLMSMHTYAEGKLPAHRGRERDKERIQNDILQILSCWQHFISNVRINGSGGAIDVQLECR